MSQDHENNADISKADPEIFALCQEEEARQIQGLELVASENFTSRAVRQALSSSFTNKYSEGYPGARYYGGNEVVDKVESLCQNRALAAFGLREEEWGVNVQPYSGTPANFAVYTGLLKPHDRIMGLDLPHGGHLSHGYQTDKKRISATSIYFESMPYRLGEDGYVDYDGLDASASLFRPKMIICGGSAYPRDWDYKRVREICDKVGAYMHVDMAHYAGLVAAKELRSPFEYADTVMTTTHKSLRGPRGAMVFYRVGDKYEYKTAIDFAVFPGLQGGPHENTIAAIAVALHETQGDHFVGYQQQVKANIKALADGLVEKGYNLVSGGTETHLILWDLRPQGVSGSKVEKVCDQVNITVNKNSVPGDRSAVVPGGLRVGAPALTSRGLKEEDFKKIAEFLHKTVEIAQEVQKETGPKLVDFMKVLVEHKDLPDLRQQVSSLASHFPMPGAGLATGELIS